MTKPKRPLLGKEDRARLRRLADKAAQNALVGHNQAYCHAVVDVLHWLDGEDMTPMLEDVTR